MLYGEVRLSGYIPGGELVLFLHILHYLLQRFFFFDIHAIAYLLLVFPIVYHLDGAHCDFLTTFYADVNVLLGMGQFGALG